jgi:predicted  nucleic acid-binding Zn-ribbon protein
MNRREIVASLVIGTPWVSTEVHGSQANFTVEDRLRAIMAKLQTNAIQAEAERAAAAAEASRLKKELNAARREIEQWKSIVEDYSQYNAAIETELHALRESK